MKAILRSGFPALAIMAPAVPAHAGPFEDGVLAAYVDGDYATAARLWRPLAEQGDAKAQKYPGVLYLNGQGVPQDQIADALTKMEGSPLYPLIALAIFTGARRGALLALRWCDIDLDAATVRIERTLEQTSAKGLRFKAPEKKSGRRKISLPGYAVAILRNHRKGQLEFRMKIGAGAPAW